MRHIPFLPLLLSILISGCGSGAETAVTTAATDPHWLDAEAAVAAFNSGQPAGREGETFPAGNVFIATTSAGQIIVQTRNLASSEDIAYVVETTQSCEACNTEMPRARVLFLHEHLIVVDEATGRSFLFGLPNYAFVTEQLAAHDYDVVVQATELARYPGLYVAPGELADAGVSRSEE